MKSLLRNLSKLTMHLQVRAGPILTIMPNDAIRRQLGTMRPKLNDPSDILDHKPPTQNIKHLSRFRVEDMAVATDPVQDDLVAQDNRLPGQEAFDATRINQLYIGKPTVHRNLKVYRFQNVFLSSRENRMSLFDRTRIDLRSTAVPGTKAVRRIRTADYVELDHAAFCGDHWLPGNPAHYVSDQLSRALIFRDRLNVPANQVLLYQSHAPLCNFMRERLDPRFRVMEPEQLYFIRNLSMLSSSRFDRAHGHPFWYLDPDLLATVREAASMDEHPGKQGSGAPSIVYLSRTDATRRRLVNEQELIDRLTRLGAQIVLMSQLSGEQQLRTVRQADIVIAPHGGALLNLIAARPGTRVVELFTPEIGTLAFAGIAQALGLDYRFHIGRKVDGRAAANAPWEADIDAVIDLAGLSS